MVGPEAGVAGRQARAAARAPGAESAHGAESSPAESTPAESTPAESAHGAESTPGPEPTHGAEPTPGNATRTGLTRRALFVDVAGLLVLGAFLLVISDAIVTQAQNDLRVYHLAVPHLLTDDVYQHLYPRWPFTYPPSALLLLAPSGLPMPTASWLMLAASVAAVWVTIHLTIRSAAGGSAWDRVGVVAIFTALTMVSWPVVFGLGLGQIAPVVMGLTALGALAPRSRWNGIWLGTAISIKLTPGAFLLFWASIGRWRSAVVAVLTFVAWIVLGAVLMPQSSWWYFGQGGAFRADQDYTRLDNQALTGIAVRLGATEPGGRALALVLSGLALVVAILVARQLVRAGWTAAAVGLVGVWSGVAAPLAWSHAFAWWGPLALAVWLCGRTAVDGLAALAIYLTPLLLLLGPLDLEPPFSAGDQLRGASYAVIALAATAFLSWRSRGTGPRQAEPVTAS